MTPLAGRLRLRAEARSGGPAFLAEQFCSAPFHVGKAYTDAATGVLLVQVVNPTAGILAGDWLESSIRVGPGAALLVTSPSASRVFRMGAGQAHSVQTLEVEAGGWLEVLPEPLVPHRGSRFRQTTRLSVAPGGGLFYADLLLPGRIAHGECWAWDRLVLELDLQIGGRPILRERFDQAPGGPRALAALAGMEAGAAFGNAIWVCPQPPPAEPDWLRLIHALQSEHCWIGASPLEDARAWSIKWMARDTALLRSTLSAIRTALAPHAPALRTDARKLAPAP